MEQQIDKPDNLITEEKKVEINKKTLFYNKAKELFFSEKSIFRLGMAYFFTCFIHQRL